MSPPPTSNKTNHPFIAGALTGGIEICITYPLEYIKTQMQFQKLGVVAQKASVPPFTNPWVVFQHTVKTHGFSTLYKGLDCWLFFAFPKAAIRFSSFDFARGHLLQDGSETLSPTRAFAAGLSAGVAEAATCITPMTTIQVKLVDDMNSSQPRFRGFFHGARTIMMEEGVSGLYRGLGPCLLRTASNQAVRFTVYGEIKKKMQGGDESVQLGVFSTMLAGGLAGSCSVALNQPVDVVRTNMQGLDGARYNSAVQCAQSIVEKQGLKGLYKGTTPRLSRVFLEVGILFTLYERIGRYLDDLLD